jgi:hypothetical protein
MGAENEGKIDVGTYCTPFKVGNETKSTHLGVRRR